MIRLLAISLIAAALSAAPAHAVARCLDPGIPLSVEEQRLVTSPVGGQLVTDGGLGDIVATFRQQLCGSRHPEQLVRDAGDRLWQAAVDRAQGRRPSGKLDRYDDRPLYWARLQMTSAVRQWTAPVDRPALLKELDEASRGLRSAAFPPAGRRIMVSGFDPFPLDGDGVTNSNPAGAAALRLDGRTVDTPDGPAVVQAVTFPVVWSAFDQGIVEDAYVPALRGRLDVLMTISQGAGFDIERWAGNWRGGDPDNEDATTAAGPIGDGPQFIETTLPYQRMLAVGPAPVELNQLYCVWPDPTHPGVGDFDFRTDGTPPAPGDVAACGSGGNYLSNESMYRANRLRLGRNDVHGGHLHVPPADATKLHEVVDQTVALVTAAG